MNSIPNRSHQPGFSMVEVLVTLVILMVGLLGLAGLMTQSQRAEMESYQRVQALILVQDMVGRINANRAVARCYGFTNTGAGAPYVGTTGAGLLAPIPPTSCALGTADQQNQFKYDIAAWNALLLGTAEAVGAAAAGAMIAARGCVSYDAGSALPQLGANGLPTGATWPDTGIYTVSVAWQGMGDSAAITDSSLLCGTGLYGAETKRRVVSMTFRIANLH